VDVLSALDTKCDVFHRSIQNFSADTTFIDAEHGFSIFLEAVFEESRGSAYEIWGA
jgi:hypothetical protein